MHRSEVVLRRLQRLVDGTVAAVVMVLGAPLLLTIAGWLRLTGVRPVLHSELRSGRRGVPFRIHKFRTFKAGASSQPSVAVAADPRVTATGRFLRRWRLDELPQLFDVLRGAMSLVGPRPQQPINLEAIPASTRERLQRVRPGITGPAAVEFLAEDEALAEVEDPVAAYRRIVLPEKIRLELAYLENWTPLADLRLLWRTALRVFSAGARQRSLDRTRRLLAAVRRR